MKTLINSFVVALVALFTIYISANAQNKNGNTLEGVWVMEKVQSDGSTTPKVCDNTYTRVKIYGKDGEYCCAQVFMDKNGKITVSPHEYGTYSYKNGKYTECGRDGGPINFTGKDNFNGHWSNITEYWNRNPKFPSDLRNLIVSKCKIVLGDKNQKNQILLKEYVLYDKK